VFVNLRKFFCILKLLKIPYAFVEYIVPTGFWISKV